MSGAMESRAAVFTSQPQAVEVYQSGAWWSGELLGWRHQSDGTCQVRVRVALGGIEETAWMDLTGLRLPERHLAVAPEPAAAADPSSTQKLPRASSADRRERPALGHPAATASMPAVRDLSVVPSGSRPGGRRRAPEAPETVAAPASPRPGGRRRAPEGAETVVATAVPAPRTGGRRRAPDIVDPVEPLEDAVASAAAAAAGRHRAAVAEDPGRHRKADTGLFPAIKDPTAKTAAVPPAVTRLDDTFGGRPRSAWAAMGEPQPELLTRPMRLSDQIPNARRPRLDGSLTGV